MWYSRGRFEVSITSNHLLPITKEDISIVASKQTGNSNWLNVKHLIHKNQNYFFLQGFFTKNDYLRMNSGHTRDKLANIFQGRAFH